jgi:hypothetical protein
MAETLLLIGLGLLAFKTVSVAVNILMQNALMIGLGLVVVALLLGYQSDREAKEREITRLERLKASYPATKGQSPVPYSPSPFPRKPS